jgi:hypothetical protein
MEEGKKTESVAPRVVSPVKPAEKAPEEAKDPGLTDLHVIMRAAPSGVAACAFDAGAGKTRYAFQVELKDGKPQRVVSVNGQPADSGWNGLTVEDFIAAGFERF